MCPRAAVFFRLNPLRAHWPPGLVDAAGFPASLRHQPEGRSHAGDYSNMRGEIGFYFGSL